jgi:hypothetical protein
MVKSARKVPRPSVPPPKLIPSAKPGPGRSAVSSTKAPPQTGPFISQIERRLGVALPKADGDAPVQAYIDALPDWQSDLASRIDAIIAREVPRVRRAIKWHNPVYGIEGQGWFAGIASFKHHLKVVFFRGSSLRPVPPGGQQKDARYLDIREDDLLDAEQLATWVRQASAMPGWWLTT